MARTGDPAGQHHGGKAIPMTEGGRHRAEERDADPAHLPVEKAKELYVDFLGFTIDSPECSQASAHGARLQRFAKTARTICSSASAAGVRLSAPSFRPLSYKI